MLAANTRSILKMNRSMKLSSAIVISEHGIVCLRETWFTEDVLTAWLFLENYQVHRSNREISENGKPKHVGVLIAIENQIILEVLTIQAPKSEHLIMEFQ